MFRTQALARHGATTGLAHRLAAIVALALFATACTGNAVDDEDAGGADDSETVAADGQLFEFQLQTGVPASSVYHGLVLKWADRLETMSGGRLKAEVLPSGAVVSAGDILDAVDTQLLDMGMAWSNYWTGKSDSAALFSNPPVGSTGMDQSTSLAWMYDGGGLALYERLYTEEIGVNVKPLPMMPMGPDPFGWFNRPITSVADVQGLKFRSPPGLPGLTFDRLGLEAVAMPGGEIVPSAENGIIEGAEWISPADDAALGLSDVWSNYYLQGLHQSTDIGELLVNIDFWESLPADLKEMILAATQATIVDSQNLSITVNAAAVAQYQADGVEVWNTPPEFYGEFVDAWNAVAEELEANDAFFAEVRSSQKEYAASVMPYRLTITELYQNIGETYFPEKVGKTP